MTQKKGVWIIVGLIIIVLLGTVGYLWKRGLFDAVVPDALQGTSVPEPQPKNELTQSARITPEEGGIIRAVDPLGVAFVLRVPPGAVKEDVEVRMTPFMPQVDGVNYGVSIEPATLIFEKSVTLGINWYLAGKLGHDNPYTATPFSVRIEGSEVDFVPLDKAAVTKNYVPILITGGGLYGLSSDIKLARKAAQKTFSESEDRFTRLYAGLSLVRQDALSRNDTAILEADIAAIQTEENPPIREVYTSVLLEEKLSAQAGMVPRAYAYGLLDGYLKFRCNLEESTYEDVLNAMVVAAHRGYADVEETCRQRVEELLLERAHEIDRDTNRPLVDAIEVLQQMQLLGLDDGAGADVAKRLSDDVLASLEKYLESQGQTPSEENTEGRVRENSPSDDPLIKGNSTLMEEMIGVHVLPFIGIQAFDENSFKEFGARTHQQMNQFIGLGKELCNLIDEFKAMGISGVGNVGTKECQKVRSGKMEEGMDVWKEQVDEYAEGVGAVQEGDTPNSNWDDLSPLESFQRFLEQ